MELKESELETKQLSKKDRVSNIHLTNGLTPGGGIEALVTDVETNIMYHNSMTVQSFVNEIQNIKNISVHHFAFLDQNPLQWKSQLINDLK